MNKGLLIHILSFVASLSCIGYVLQGDDHKIGTRVTVILCILMVQLFATGINDINNNYKKKL